jgi:arabinosyltransferase C
VTLPFGLDPARTPVLGSYKDGDQTPATLTTNWYRLNRSGPLLVVTAAGRIKSVDKDGVVKYGQDVVIEYGRDGKTMGSVVPYDIGPNPSWRNLRVPLDQIPPDADSVRIVATDNDITQRQWLAITPPRVPQLRTLQDVVGTSAPTLLDWHVGLAFPCQRPFDHKDGVAEVPTFRITPDRGGLDAANKWQDEIGGGPLGWIPLLLNEQTEPTYLDNDWRRDWGSLETLKPYEPGAAPASVSVTKVDRSGLWHPDPIRVR